MGNFEKPVNPKKLAKVNLLGITFERIAKGELLLKRDGEYLYHNNGMPHNFGYNMVVRKTMKRAVQAALQSMDKTRFYWR